MQRKCHYPSTILTLLRYQEKIKVDPPQRGRRGRSSNESDLSLLTDIHEMSISKLSLDSIELELENRSLKTFHFIILRLLINFLSFIYKFRELILSIHIINLLHCHFSNTHFLLQMNQLLDLKIKFTGNNINFETNIYLQNTARSIYS